MRDVTLLAVVIALTTFLLSLRSVVSDCPSLANGGTPHRTYANFTLLDNLDFLTVFNKSRIYINICGPSKACKDGDRACSYTTPTDTYTQLSDGTAPTVTENADYLHVSMVTGDRITANITFICSNSLGRPQVQMMSSDVMLVMWPSLVACKDTTLPDYYKIIPCYSYHSDQNLYDLSYLVGKEYTITRNESNVLQSYTFSLCGSVTGDGSCNGGSLCHNGASLGDVGLGPSASSDSIIMSYNHSNTDQSECKLTTVIVVLICTPHQQSLPEIIESSKKCNLQLLWKTEYACKFTPVRDATLPCQINSLYGLSYDLTPLMDEGFETTDAEHRYIIGVCGNLRLPCKGVPSSGCISNTDQGNAWSMGSYHPGNLVLDDDGLVLTYTEGSQCSKGPIRATKILFVCDKNVDKGAPELVGQQYCFYSFIWRTKYACPSVKTKECTFYGTDGEKYDLYGLKSQNWIPVPADNQSNEELLVSVCGEVPGCPGGSLCRKESGSAKYEPLAGLTNTYKFNKDKSFEMSFAGVGSCQQSKATLNVEMTCKPGSLTKPPTLLSVEQCSYSVSWQTGYACPQTHLQSVGTCKLQDSITGLTYDLSPLKTGDVIVKSSISSSSTSDVIISMCGRVQDSRCPKDVSVCRTDGVNLGSYNTEVLHFEGTLAMSFTGGKCGDDEYYVTIINFVCNPTKDEVDLNVNGCYVIVTWNTPVSCPEFVMECVATNSTHSYDLSPLHDLGTLQWSGEINGTTAAVYMRVCGQVTAGTESCDHTAGVCVVMEKEQKKVAMNFGRTSSNLVVEDNIIAETYRNGDKICNDTSLQVETRVEYRCTNGDKSQIESAFFSDELCMLVVIIASPYGCTQQPITASNCSVTDAQGYHYDFSFLDGDYKVMNSIAVYEVHLCGTLSDPCGNNVNSASCETVQGNKISLGKATTMTLTEKSGTFTVSYTEGDFCRKDGENEIFKETRIQLMCNRGITKDNLGVPTYINTDSENCVFDFTWEMAAACPPQKLQCRAIDSSLREYDLSVFHRETPWVVRGKEGQVYYINVCGPIDESDYQGTAIKKINKAGETVSLGKPSGEPSVLADGNIQLEYYHGDKCGGSDSTRTWTTSMVFICEPQSEALPMVTEDEAACHVVVTWRTLHACPAAYVIGDGDCRVTNPNTGVTYDLSKLSVKDFEFSHDKYTYRFSFCKGLQSGCNGEASSGACQQEKSNAGTVREKNNGLFNKTVIFSSGSLILTYRNGDMCSGGDIRETMINMVCDHTMLSNEVEFVVVNETSHCVYEVFAFSGLPCDKEILYECEVDGYDIKSLALTRSNYYVDTNQHTYAINICRGLNKPSKCTADTAVCLSTDGNHGISIGTVDTAEVVFQEGSLRLRYQGADICSLTGKPYTTSITFMCAADDTVGKPQYLSNSTCGFNFIWSTRYACKDAILGQGCKILDSISGKTLYDLSNIAQSYSYHHGDKQFEISICGKLSETSCKANTAVCTKNKDGSTISLGAFSSSTRLELDSGRMVLTYGDGDQCTETDDASPTSYTSQIEFTCPKAGTPDSEITLLSKDHCMAYFTFATKYACVREKIACEVVKDGTTVDLSFLQAEAFYEVSSRIPSGGRMRISVCQSLDNSKTGCVAHSAACLLPINGSNPKDLGHVESGLAVTGDGNIELVYSNGDSCTNHNGVKGLTRTIITFVCDETYKNNPTLTLFTGCDYYIMWHVDRVCEGDDKPPSPVGTCEVTDPHSGYTYNLKTLTRYNDFYQTKDGLYTANICGSVPSCSDDAAICYTPSSGSQVSLGSVKTVQASLFAGEKGEVVVTYEDGDTCPGGNKKRHSTIIILCCEAEESPLTLISENGCSYAFTLCSSDICQYAPKECTFELNNNYFDFAPLVRRYDNWNVQTPDKDITFYINPCRGVNLRAIPNPGCKDGSAICMTEKGVKESRSLGLSETRSQTVRGSDILISYSDGSSSVCPGKTVRSEINFVCGNSLGSPTFSNDKDCVYKFEWVSYVACNESSKPVISKTCTYEHPLTHKMINLDQITDKDFFEVDSLRGKVYFTQCDTGKLPKDKCKASSDVCFVDDITGTTVSFEASERDIYVLDNSAEVVLRSRVKCEDSPSRTWTGVVEYTCSENGTVVPRFRALSHCHILLSVETPIVCADYSPSHPSWRIVVILIMLAVVLFIVAMIAYSCVDQQRRGKLMRKIRSFIPVRGSRSMSQPYSRLMAQDSYDNALFSDDDEMLGL